MRRKQKEIEKGNEVTRHSAKAGTKLNMLTTLGIANQNAGQLEKHQATRRKIENRTNPVLTLSPTAHGYSKLKPE